MTAELVVKLPSDNRRALGIVLSHGPHDAVRELAIDGAGGAILPAHAKGHSPAVAVDPHDLGIAGAEPGGRCGRWRAENGLDAVASQEIDGVIEPAEFVAPFFGLEQGPGELGHAHDADARLAHQARIGLPTSARPVLRIIVYAIVHGDRSSPTCS
jgi:hypothetical protein